MNVVANLAKLGLCVDAHTKQTATSHERFPDIEKHTIGDVILYEQAEESHQYATTDQHTREGVGDFVFHIQLSPADVTIFVVVY